MSAPVLHPERLQERADQLAAAGLNGFRMAWVTLDAADPPQFAWLDLAFVCRIRCQSGGRWRRQWQWYTDRCSGLPDRQPRDRRPQRLRPLLENRHLVAG